ncbi:hypothetical protein [Allorhizocola rhizosphaerae]|uniref:hypothetical protein n=1 Tax=Allorhizocola rhizosphaerae TaxID=1872709 RepID=UPI000E3C6E92|nr:hypothetical protein [Allorhizocola rhizosphaerae]
MRFACAVVVVVVLLAGCGGDAREELVWHPLTLPNPPGEVARQLPRKVVACGSMWWVVGGVADASGATRPAVWASIDGSAWSPVRLVPKSYYGERSVLYAAACHDGKLVTIGGKSGGAHGNPRISTWYQESTGALSEVEAYFELFGGNTMVRAARMAGGPRGWMIAGSRTGGAAVWTSADATSFTLREDVPELRSDQRGSTWATDVVATAEGWLLSGGVRQRIDGDPLLWTSADGVSWSRLSPPATGEHEEIQRLLARDGVVYGLGLKGRSFAVWRVESGTAKIIGTFGEHASTGVASAVSFGRIAVVSTGTEYELWSSTDLERWRRVSGPAGAMSAQGDRYAAAAVSAGRIILLADDGVSGRLWSAEIGA